MRPRHIPSLPIIVVAALLLALPSIGHTQENEAVTLRLPDADQVDAVFARFDMPGSVGCALGVAHQGELVYKNGYGYANLDWDIPMSPTTVIYVGSISKQFTAAAIALLANEGKLDLDDDVREHLPQMPHRAPPITVRQLVHHTSGVPDMYRVMRDNDLTTWDRFSRDQALELLSRQELDFPPGDRYQYSNGGYFLLSMIVQRASGQTLREYSQEKIFEPLGMRDTHFHDDPVHIVKNRAMSYMPAANDSVEGGDNRYVQSYQGNFALPGAGGLYSTVEDLERWDRNFLDNKLGGPDFMGVMHTKGVLNSGETLDYAFAIREDQHRGRRTLGHGGSFMGFKAHYVRFPDQQLSTWVMCNMGEIVPEELALQVADIYLADPAAVAADRPQRSTPPAHVNAVKLGWETTAFGIQRWNTVIGGDSIPDDDLQVGLWELAPRAIYAGHVHPVPEFYVVLDGRAEWTLGADTFIAERGEVVYIAPNTMHRMVNLTDDMVQAIWGRWAPNGDRSVFEGEYRFVEPLPEQPPEAVFPEPGQ